MSLKIIGTGRAIPTKQVSNEDLSAFLDTDDRWITEKTGIHSRHICTVESLTDLAETAAKSALQDAGIAPSHIDLILCATICGDFATPSLACCIAERLSTDCPAFDLNAACSGFVYALDVAAAYLDSGRAEHILLISAEKMSNYVDWRDRSTCVLFGDGAGACVITKGGALRHMHLSAQGDTQTLRMHTRPGNSPFAQKNAESDNKPHESYLLMDGQAVYRFAVQTVENETARAFSATGFGPDDIDYYLIHQANQRILDSARSRLGQPAEKMPANIHTYGNISGASIPILLDELREKGNIQTGHVLFIAAFGAGLTTGSCVMVWE